jgi:hypothetical protein
MSAHLCGHAYRAGESVCYYCGAGATVSAPLIERRKRGRPVGEPREKLNLWVPPSIYDRICAIALRVDKPVTVVARMMLERDLARQESTSA